MRGWRLVLVVPVLAFLLIVGSAVANDVIGAVVNDEIDAKAPKKTTLVRVAGNQITSSNTFADVPGATATITFGKPSIILATFSAESSCYDGAEYCAMQILVGNTEMEPASEGNYAFDSSEANEGQASWEGRSFQRSLGPLPPGTYTVRPQWAVVGTGSFWLGDIHVTVQTIQP